MTRAERRQPSSVRASRTSPLRARPEALAGAAVSGMGRWTAHLEVRGVRAAFGFATRALAGRPVARDALVAVALTGMGALLGYLVQILVSRTIGLQQFGTYAYVLGLVNIARIVVSASLDMGALRFAGVYHQSGDWSRLRGFVGGSRAVIALLSGLATLAGLLVASRIEERLPAGFAGALIGGCALIMPSALLSFEVYLLQAFRRVYAARVPMLVIRPVLIALALWAAVALGHGERSAAVALWANAVGVSVALAISFVLTQRVLPEATRRVAPRREIRQWGAFSAVNVAQNILYLLLSQQADIVIVGSLVGTTDAGLYAAASQVTTLVLLGVSAVNQFTSPLLADFHDRPRDARLRGLLARAMVLNGMLSLPLIAMVVAVGPLLLGSFGPSFVAAYPVIVILSIGCLVNAVWGGLWGDLLTMTGFQNDSALVVVSVAVLNLALTAVLTPRLGIEGAAYATTGAVLVRGLIIAVIVRKRLGFWPWTIGFPRFPWSRP